MGKGGGGVLEWDLTYSLSICTNRRHFARFAFGMQNGSQTLVRRVPAKKMNRILIVCNVPKWICCRKRLNGCWIEGVKRQEGCAWCMDHDLDAFLETRPGLFNLHKGSYHIHTEDQQCNRQEWLTVQAGVKYIEYILDKIVM